ncbi:helicase domain protein, partial [mine drainage metagenome]
LSACARLGAPLGTARNGQFRLLPQRLPEALRLRLADEGISKTLNLDFTELHRSHPLVTTLAEHLLETSLQGDSGLAARCAATLTDAVDVVTTLYLLRLRHQLSYVRRREPFQVMAEETVTLAVKGRSQPEWLSGDAVSALLECTPSGNLAPEAVQREIRAALEFLHVQPQRLEDLARERAAVLLADTSACATAAR